MPNDFTLVLDTTTLVLPFLHPHAFEFWRNLFTAVTIPSSQGVGLCIALMHAYWQAIMTSFNEKLFGSYGFSLVPPEGLHAIISPNPRLLFPTKSVIAYARKQNKFAIFKWQEKEQGWFLYTSEFSRGWEKKVKIVNLPASMKKGL